MPTLESLLGLGLRDDGGTPGTFLTMREFATTAALEAHVFTSADRGRLAYDTTLSRIYQCTGAGTGYAALKGIGGSRVPATGLQLESWSYPDSGSPAVAMPSYTINGIPAPNGGSKADNPTFALAFNTSVNGSQTNTAFPSIGVHFEGSYEPSSARRAELHVISAVPGGSSLRQISLANGADVGAGITFLNDTVIFGLPDATNLLEIATGGIAAKGGRAFIGDTNNAGAFFVRNASAGYTECLRMTSANWMQMGASGALTGISLAAARLIVGFFGDSAIDSQSQVVHSIPDTTSIFGFRTTSTNGATVEFFVGVQDPNGVVTAKQGSFYFRAANANSNLYVNRSAGATGTTWAALL